jgi:hypothetical protein
MALDPNAIAAAVKAEIEKQQAAVNYDDLSEADLQAIVGQLTSKLELCKSALAAKSGGAAAAPAMKAAKSTGTYPDLPWGGKRAERLPEACPPSVLPWCWVAPLCTLTRFAITAVLPQLRASRTQLRSPHTSRSRCRSAS